MSFIKNLRFCLGILSSELETLNCMLTEIDKNAHASIEFAAVAAHINIQTLLHNVSKDTFLLSDFNCRFRIELSFFVC